MRCTHLVVAHGCHNAVSTGIKGSFDHPFLCPRNADNRACIFGANGIVELDIVSRRSTRMKMNSASANLVVVLIRNQSMLCVNQYPTEFR